MKREHRKQVAELVTVFRASSASGDIQARKPPRRTRQRFLRSLEGDDYRASCDLLPGNVLVEDGGRTPVRLQVVPNRSDVGYPGTGNTPMEALRDAAWNWLDARKRGAP